MIEVLVRSGPEAGQRFSLQKERIRIGRKGCDINLTGDLSVSSVHCEIAVVDGIYSITDLDSSNGTRIGNPDAQPIPVNTAVRLRPNDEVHLGDLVISVVSRPTIRPAKSKWDIASKKGRTAEDVPVVAPTGLRIQPEKTSWDAAKNRSAATGDTVLEQGGSGVLHQPGSGVLHQPGSGVLHQPGSGLHRGVSESGFIATDPLATPERQESDCVVIEALDDDQDPAEVYAEYEQLPSLFFVSGLHEGRAVFLGRDTITIGRAESNNVVLLDSMVSLHHCFVVPGQEGIEIRPFSDATIVKVNDERVQASQRLVDEDLITIGASELTFHNPTEEETIVGVDPGKLSPVYAFLGMVKRQPILTIGRDTDRDLFLQHHRVEGLHAGIELTADGFVITDFSQDGVYVNGHRVFECLLASGDIATIGGFALEFEISGRRLGIDLSAPEDADVIPQFVAGPEGSALKGIHRAAEDKKSSVSAAAGADRDRAAVLWVEPHDVKIQWRSRLMLLVALLSTAFVLVAIQQQSSGAFVRKPLSSAHKSEEFRTQAKEIHPEGAGCRPCHVAFKGPMVERCVRCHEPHALREGHAKEESLKSGGCIDCHTEHLEAPGAPRLVRGAGCAACHDNRHAAFFPATPPGTEKRQPQTERAKARRAAFGVDLYADVAFTKEQKYIDVHQRHLEALEGRCTACHQPGGGEEEDVGSTQRTCFGCHGPTTAEAAMGAAGLSCSDCHREDEADWAIARAQPGMAPAPSKETRLWLFLLLLPLSLFGFHSLYSSRTRAPMFKPPPIEEGPLECDGVELAKARKLPRLLASRCIGAADCVEACPYGVLQIQAEGPRQPMIVRPDLCHECGTCVERCGPQALVLMVPGEPLPLVDRPLVDANYEASIGGSNGGVYVIGEAAAKPGVKNAINVGHSTILHIRTKGIGAGVAQRLGAQVEVLIAGSGPAGLSAALSAKESNLSFVVLERSASVAATTRQYPKGKTVQISPPSPKEPRAPEPGEVAKIGLLWFDRETTREELLQLWSEQAKSLDIRAHTLIEGIKYNGAYFEVTTNQGIFTTLNVILAPGVRGDPRTLGVPGQELAKVRYHLDDPAAYVGKHCAVVGGGNSAVEAAVSLAQAGAHVSIIYRKAEFSRATTRNRKAIDKLIQDGKIKAFFESNPTEITEGAIALDKSQGEIQNEVTFCMLGANAPTAWLKKLGIEVTKKSTDWEPGPTDRPAFAQLGVAADPTVDTLQDIQL